MKTVVIADRRVSVGEIAPAMFSSFIEHLGRAVYGGIYDPKHPSADEDGFRSDVLHLCKDLNLAYVRYPGGNFVSNYDWENGIGPREKRPQFTDMAWHSIEPNWIGVDEFMRWCTKVGVKPMMAVNLGTGTVEKARDLIEYCNGNGDGKYASLRRKYGSKEPYSIPVWCLGNEMDGDWQIGHLPAPEYCVKAKKAADLMRAVDPSVKFVACGSSAIYMPTFPEWDRTVLETLWNDIDYLSIHHYYFENATEPDYFASCVSMQSYIDTMRSILVYAKAKNRSKKDVYLCFDEFNIWYNNKPLPTDFKIAPHLLEEQQSLKDTIVFTSLLNTLLNNCDVVKVACLAQLVNVIAPILTNEEGDVLKNAIYEPYRLVSAYCRGKTLRSSILGETFPSASGDAHYISSCVTEDGDGVTVLLTNFAKEENEVSVELRGCEGWSIAKEISLYGDDPSAFNDFPCKDKVVPFETKNASTDQGVLQVKMPPLSWTLVRLKA